MPAVTRAQHTVKHYNILWASYNNTFHLNHKWSLVNDVQVRTINWADKWLLYAARSGVSYNVNENFAITTGVTLFRNAQYAGNSLFFKNEWRSWEEVSYNWKLRNKVNLFQRLRAEQRFLQITVNNQKTQNYMYILRLRYRFEWTLPLRIKNINLLSGNEVFINPGYLNNTLFFDQNRTFAGVNYKTSSNSSLQGQYIKIFQWRSNTSVLENQNVIRVSYIQQFNKKIKSKKI